MSVVHQKLIVLTNLLLPTIEVEKRHKIVDHVFGNTLYFKLMYFLFLIPNLVIFIDSSSILVRFPVGVVTLYGILIFLYDLVTERNILKNKYFPYLFIFVFLLTLSIFANIWYGSLLDIRPAVYTIIEVFVVAMVPFNKSRDKNYKELKIVNNVMIVTLCIVCFVSLVTFVFSIDGVHTFFSNQYIVGWRRYRGLFGLSGNPNLVGRISVLAICLIVFHLCIFTCRRWPYLVAMTIVVTTAILANSRGSNLGLYTFIFFSVFLFKYVNSKNIIASNDLKRFLYSALTAAIVLAAYVQVQTLVRPGLGYFPPAVQYIRTIVARIGSSAYQQQHHYSLTETNLYTLEPTLPIVFTPIDTVRLGEAVVRGRVTGTGRFTIWNDRIQTIVRYPIFGVGLTGVATRTEMGGSSHNVYLDLLSVYGVFPFIAFIILAIKLLIDAHNKIQSYIHTNTFSMYFVISLSIIALYIVHGLTDSLGIIVAGRTLASFIFAFFLGTLFTVMNEESLCEIKQ